MFVLELSFESFGLGSLACIFCLRSLSWNLRLEILGLGVLDPEAGGTAWPYPGNPAGPPAAPGL